MMYEPEKSDGRIVPRKSPNNVERSAAEGMEGRCLVKGRPVGNARSGHRTGPACHLRRRGPVAQLHGSPKPRTAQWYHPRQEPGAGKPHAGICAGGGEKSPSLPRPAHARNDGMESWRTYFAASRQVDDRGNSQLSAAKVLGYG